jgi:sulfite reductase alpha subunit-like flavoprotein
MFGERMVIANSSGCSSVWGGSYGISPFKANKHGQGPAWARSLFEDTAEYGLGMQLGSEQRRDRLVASVTALLDSKSATSPELSALLEQWLQVASDSDKCETLQRPILDLLDKECTEDSHELLQAVKASSDLLVRPSHWIIGGDGWAYDIGFGGLDHVLASGQNINILVLDTEGYSNTGAQVSKATPKGATMKMAAGGRESAKKDLGAIAMMHEVAYVASVSMASDPGQTVKAFREAEQYPGPSIILSYATCVDWGHRMGDKAMVQQQIQVVDGGYWPLYRYNPAKRGTDENPFSLDARRIDGKALESHLKSENRFASLMRAAPEHAKNLQESLTSSITEGHEVRRRRAMNDEDLLDYLKKTMGESVTGERVTILYGSDTGTAEMVAKNHQFELKRRGMKAKCLAFDDLDIADLADETKVIAFVATAGQGEMPKTALKFWAEMEQFLELPGKENFLGNTQFAVFGMGDSSYVFFNEAASKIDSMFEKLGATRIQEMGQGDDQHAERYDTELEEWTPNVFDAIEAPPPPQELGEPSHKIEVLDSSSPLNKKAQEPLVPISHASKPIKLTKILSTVPEGYERPIDHFEFDLEGSGLVYDQGDSLGLFPHSDKEQVDMTLAALKMTGDEVLHIKNIDSNRSNPLPEAITTRTLFTEVLDIGGWPKRRFYEMLKMGTTDAGEKAELELICSKEGKPILKSNNEESFTYAELLMKYPNAVPSIGHLIDYVPDIKPRLYSIASSPRMRGEDKECHLCIIKNEWTATSGRNRVGLCTRWLCELNVDGGHMNLPGFVHASAVVMPNSHEVPMVMVGLGTGIAPMRCFIEERVMAARAGEKCGEMALFFGARNRQEYSYEEEFSGYHEEGPLTHIFTALSREQKEKIYVTHRLAQNMPIIYDLIHEKNGNLYLCGPGGNVPPQVRLAVIQSIEEVGGHSREYAEKYVTEMQINGRYNVEAW